MPSFSLLLHRISNIGKLSVQQLSSPELSDPLLVQDVAQPGNSRLDLNSSADLYIGGAPDGYRVRNMNSV